MSQPENVSERLPQTDAEADLLKTAIAELLRTVPKTWAEFDLEGLTRVQDNALFLLTAAGMVERRGWLRSSIANHPTCFEVCFQATGEGGFVNAMEKAHAVEYATWCDAWRAWKAGETGHVSPFHTEAMKPQEWRLTDQGILARGDLDGTNPDPIPNRVFDFVLKSDFYGPGYWWRVGWSNRKKFEENKRLIAEQADAYGKDWTELPRPPVGGDGLLVAIRKIEQPAGPHAVNVANWSEGGDAFAAAFDELLGRHFRGMANSTQGTDPPAVPDAESPNAKESAASDTQPTLGKEARALALLTEHPGWTDAEIARNVPCSRTSLYRFKKYVQARELLESTRMETARGSKTKGGEIEAWNDE
jgi:hypothetical protein